jgi:hypothetical protein
MKHLSELYQYLKSSDLYSAWLIKKIALSGMDAEVLRSHDLEPVNGEYQKLGEGSEGVVYLVNYRGTVAAAKITYGQAVLEVRKWKDILKLDLPAEYKKHIPRIYLAEINQNSNLPDHQIIVMENLEPLQGEKLDALFPDLEGAGVYYQRLAELINQPELLKSSVDYAVGVSSIELSEQVELKQQLIQYLSGYVIPEEMDNERLSKRVREDLFNYLVQIIPEVEVDEFASMLDGIFGDDSSSRDIEADKIAETFVDYTIQRQFPYGHGMWSENTGLEYFRHHPASRGLLETLLYIAKNAGIGWADVKPQNLMVRPSTGDIVIIDVGRYNKIH